MDALTFSLGLDTAQFALGANRGLKLLGDLQAAAANTGRPFQALAARFNPAAASQGRGPLTTNPFTSYLGAGTPRRQIGPGDPGGPLAPYLRPAGGGANHPIIDVTPIGGTGGRGGGGGISRLLLGNGGNPAAPLSQPGAFAILGRLTKFITPATVALGALTVGSVALYKTFQEVTAAVHNGTQLFHESFRTGTSIKSLYQTRAGLTAAGVDAAEAPAILFRIQRALSGVSETGERTTNTFAQLGLNMATLRQQEPGKQLDAIVGALAQAPRALQTGFASNIFGRFGAQTALQLAREQDTFHGGYNDSAGRAQVMAQNAGTFAKFSRELGKALANLEIAATTFAAQVVPGLTRVLEALNRIPWARLGDLAGRLFKIWAIGSNFGFLVDDVDHRRNPNKPASPTGFIPAAGENAFASMAPKTDNVTSLEKMGFILGGGPQVAALDFARRTAKATEQIAHHLAGNANTANKMLPMFNQP